MSLLPGRFYLDNFFDDFTKELGNHNMKCDIYEKDNNYNIIMDIPGFDKKDIKVECNNGYLTIEASKETNTEDNEKNYIKRERTYGNYSRQFYVGEIDEENIKAEFKDGTLKLEIPKLTEKTSKKIIDIM